MDGVSFGIVSFSCCYAFFFNGISSFILRASWRRNLELACGFLHVCHVQLELTLFSLYFPWIANYQIVMISFINSNTCRSICCWLCWLLIFVYACSNLGWRIYWPLLWVFWFRHFLIIGGWCFSSYCGCFGNFSWINCYLGWWYLAYWVSSSGES
jgi:hypothetical protein